MPKGRRADVPSSPRAEGFRRGRHRRNDERDKFTGAGGDAARGAAENIVNAPNVHWARGDGRAKQIGVALRIRGEPVKRGRGVGAGVGQRQVNIEPSPKVSPGVWPEMVTFCSSV